MWWQVPDISTGQAVCSAQQAQQKKLSSAPQLPATSINSGSCCGIVWQLHMHHPTRLARITPPKCPAVST